MNRAQLVTLLGTLIESCRNGERTHRAIASYLTDGKEYIRFLFDQYALQRGQFADNLQAELWSLTDRNADPVCQPVQPPESPLQPYTRQALLVRCVRSESLAIERHQYALTFDLPPHIHTIVRSQYVQICEAYHRIQSLKYGIDSI